MTTSFNDIFTRKALEDLFPKDRANQFFDALFGDADEGAYDISLAYKKHTPGELWFEFHLNQRPGRCLACNLTYGLPQVFSRHPIININGLAEQISQLLNGQGKCTGWRLGTTQEISRALHVIPLIISLDT